MPAPAWLASMPMALGFIENQGGEPGNSCHRGRGIFRLDGAKVLQTRSVQPEAPRKRRYIDPFTRSIAVVAHDWKPNSLQVPSDLVFSTGGWADLEQGTPVKGFEG